MKFDCGETYAEWEERIGRWHSWFAWYPVRVGKHDCRWLERVERKGTVEFSYDGLYTNWQYRAKENK